MSTSSTYSTTSSAGRLLTNRWIARNRRVRCAFFQGQLTIGLGRFSPIPYRLRSQLMAETLIEISTRWARTRINSSWVQVGRL